MQDERPTGRDATQSWLGSRQPSAIRRHALTAPRFQLNTDAAEMTHDELRKIESARRKALWALANLKLGDPKASELLATLDTLDDQDRSLTASDFDQVELTEVRASVPVQHHQSGIDIVLEIGIPEPWRERFLQASIGSTRFPDGPYAVDWDKFLTTWEAEMEHLQQHQAARPKPRID